MNDVSPLGRGDIASDVPAHLRGRAALVVIAVCLALAALEGYDLQAVGVAAPAMAPQLHISPRQVGYAASLTMAAMGLGALVAGPIADRFGRKLVLVVSAGLFGLSSIATAGVWDAPSLDLARVATGAGFGGAMPCLITIAADASAPDWRGRAVASVSAGLPLGAALCALVAGLGSRHLDWRMLFVTGGLATLAATPLAARFVPPDRRRSAPEREDRRSLSGLFLEGRWAATLSMWVAICLTMTVLSVMTTWLPTLMIAMGQSRDVGSLAAAAFNGAGIVGGLTVGYFVDRHGPGRSLVAVFTALAGVVAIMSVARGGLALMVCAAAVGVLVIGAQFGLYASFPGYYPTALRATGSGGGVAAGRVGSVIGPALVGELLTRGVTDGGIVLALLPAIVGAGVACMALARFGRSYAD